MDSNEQGPPRPDIQAKQPDCENPVEIIHTDGSKTVACIKKIRKFRLKIQWLMVLITLVLVILWWFGMEWIKHLALGFVLEQAIHHTGLIALGTEA